MLFSPQLFNILAAVYELPVTRLPLPLPPPDAPPAVSLTTSLPSAPDWLRPPPSVVRFLKRRSPAVRRSRSVSEGRGPHAKGSDDEGSNGGGRVADERKASETEQGSATATAVPVAAMVSTFAAAAGDKDGVIEAMIAKRGTSPASATSDAEMHSGHAAPGASKTVAPVSEEATSGKGAAVPESGGFLSRFLRH